MTRRVSVCRWDRQHGTSVRAVTGGLLTLSRRHGHLADAGLDAHLALNTERIMSAGLCSARAEASPAIRKLPGMGGKSGWSICPHPGCGRKVLRSTVSIQGDVEPPNLPLPLAPHRGSAQPAGIRGAAIVVSAVPS